MNKNYIFTGLLITVGLLSTAQTPPAIQWQKNFGGSQYEGESGDGSIKETPDGGYIVTGASYSNDVDVTGNHA